MEIRSLYLLMLIPATMIRGVFLTCFLKYHVNCIVIILTIHLLTTVNILILWQDT